MGKSIKLVKQPANELGCGIACVSALTGKSYSSLKDKLVKMDCWTENKNGDFRTQPDQLSALLKEVGIDHKVEKFSSIELIPAPAIIAVNNKKGNFHWVIAFNNKGCVFILDTEDGELYRYENWKDSYRFYRSKNCIVFPDLIISGLKF